MVEYAIPLVKRTLRKNIEDDFKIMQDNKINFPARKGAGLEETISIRRLFGMFSQERNVLKMLHEYAEFYAGENQGLVIDEWFADTMTELA